MRIFLPLILALIFPIPAMASKTQAANTEADPATSQELKSLNKQRVALQNEHTSLTGKEDFWHTLTIVLGVIAAIVGILAGASAMVESKRSYAQRGIDGRLAVVDGQISDWKRRDADWRIEAANLKRVALENRIADIFGPRKLTFEQATRIAERLKGLKGTKVDVYVYAVDNPYTAADFKDSRDIAVAVAGILQAADLDAAIWLLQDCHGASASNLVVGATEDNVGDSNIGSQLIKAFQPEIETDPNVEKFLTPSAWCGSILDLDDSRPNKRQHDAKISMIIGRKTNPPLTREMLEPPAEQAKP